MDKVTQAEWKMSGLCVGCGRDLRVLTHSNTQITISRAVHTALLKDGLHRCYNCWIDTD